MSIRKRVKILFVHNSLRKFVEIDRDILKEKYDVTEWEIKNYFINPLEVLWKVAHHDLVFCWFASWFSLLPVLFSRLMNKLSVVVSGCYETVADKNMRFGFQQDGLRKYIPKAIFANADKVIVPSQFSFKETMQNMGPCENRMIKIYQGLDSALYPIGMKKESIVITIGDVNEENIQRKGFDTFVLAAEHLPGIKFIIIGKCHGTAFNRLKKICPPNVHFTDYLVFDEMIALMQKAKVYVQASQHEAFGLAMAEAMLCECIPVISNKAALPEVVGTAGFYADSNKPEDFAKAIRAALDADSSLGTAARDRISTQFNIENRKQELFKLIESLLQNHKKERSH